MKRIIALILAVMMCVSLMACNSNPQNNGTEPNGTTIRNPNTTNGTEDADDLVILYTNDVHCYIDGPLSYDVIGGFKEALKGKYKNVLLLDAGDAVQGTAFGSMDKGNTIVNLMNMAGYDAATLGNHEFDYGMDGCKNVIEWANHPYLSCNFFNLKNGKQDTTVLSPYKIFEMGGKKVAVVGITTPESFTKSTPAYFQDDKGNYIYDIAGGDDGAQLYKAVQDAVDAAKAEGADMVIALGHLGVDESSGAWTSKKTIANVTGLDAFIDGHSHTVIESEMVKDKNGKEVLLTQTGEYFNSIGMMVIDGKTGAITTDLIGYNEIREVVKDENGDPVLDSDGKEVTEVTGYVFDTQFDLQMEWCEDEDLDAAIDAWIKEIDKKLGKTIGSTAISFDNYDADGNRLVRSQETNTGDFAADALYYLFDNMGLDVDVAIMNGGGVRNKEITGELSYLTAKNIHTFGNVACLQTVTGQQLLDALEWGARCVGTGEECGGFLHVAGITYKIDTDWASSVQMDDKGVWVGAPTGGYRVCDVKVYNKTSGEYEPLDLDAKYNLAGYNYTLRDLGDGFAMFSSAVNVLDYVMEDYLVLANYIQAFENGKIEAANSPLLTKYAGMLLDYSSVNGSGRIVIE